MNAGVNQEIGTVCKKRDDSLFGLNQERSYYLDCLKVLATVCLFLAHVEAPFWLKEVRSFDVPLLVFISGILAADSYSRAKSGKSYIWKRVKRLAVPTWLFLVVFYACMVLVGQTPNISDVIKSLLFQRDCGLAGGVWIILVYLLCAVVTPLLLRFKDQKSFWIAMALIYIGYEFLVTLTDAVNVRLIYYTILTVVPYGTMMFLGIKFKEMTTSQRVGMGIVALAIYIGCQVFLYVQGSGYVSLGDYKYPARLYYLSYALPICVLLLMLGERFDSKLPRIALVTFISKHSLWIYLWQILLLATVNYVLKISDYWLLSLVVLLFGSCLITYVQNAIVNCICRNHNYKWARFFTC